MTNLNKYRNYFKYKISMIDFYSIKQVRTIVDSCKDVIKSKRKKYIEDNNIRKCLEELYWLKIYKNEEDFNDAYKILTETIFNVNFEKDHSDKESVDIIIDKCASINKEYLSTKILNSCPNGARNLVNHIINDILEY